MVNSIRKGKAFEREVAKLLGKITLNTYTRIPQSGGTATHWNLSNLCGDIISIKVLNGEEKQKYVIECKATAKSIEIQDFFNEKSLFFDYIRQTLKEAKSINSKEWYLFVKINRKGVYLITDKKGKISNFFKEKPMIMLSMEKLKCKFIKIE